MGIELNVISLRHLKRKFEMPSNVMNITTTSQISKRHGRIRKERSLTKEESIQAPLYKIVKDLLVKLFISNWEQANEVFGKEAKVAYLLLWMWRRSHVQ
jgi:hypothetical protein